MRYIVSVVLFILALTSCKRDTPRYVIGMSQCSDDSWRHKMNDEILREAMFYEGVSVCTFVFNDCTNGRRKASVLPEPVGESSTKSLFS